jgi:hypothetical protein
VSGVWEGGEVGGVSAAASTAHTRSRAREGGGHTADRGGAGVEVRVRVWAADQGRVSRRSPAGVGERWHAFGREPAVALAGVQFAERVALR